MNRVSVIMPNPAHIEEVELDRDEVDPADLTPLISGETPFITVPALEVEDTAEEAVEDKDGDVAEEFVKDNDEDENVDDVLEKLGKSQELLKEIRDIVSSISEDTSSRQHTVVPIVDVWDTGKAIEQEYRLHPDPTMKEVRDRLSNQVWDLLQILQERVETETVLKHQAEKP